MREMLGNPSATAHHPFRIIHASFAASIHNHTTQPWLLHHCSFGWIFQRTFLFSLKHEKLNLDLRSEWLCFSCAIIGTDWGQAGPDSTDVSLNKPGLWLCLGAQGRLWLVWGLGLLLSPQLLLLAISMGIS